MNYVDYRGMKKRPLRKVRKDYIYKKPPKDTLFSPDFVTPCLNEGKVNTIAQSIGLVEVNRQIFLETKFLNEYYKINHIEIHSIENKLNSLTVTLSLSINENSNITPWQYTVKRLESYGDLNLATWAYKAKKYYSNHSEAITRYFELLRLDEQRGFSALEKARTKAFLTCQEIENGFAFHKAVLFANKENTELLSISFDEGFLKGMNHTPESFASWSKVNGLPTLFKNDCSINMKFGNSILDGVVINAKSIQEGPEFECSLIGEGENLQKLTMQNIIILCPDKEGVYMYCYYIIKDNKDEKGKSIIEERASFGLKTYKSIYDNILKDIAVSGHLDKPRNYAK